MPDSFSGSSGVNSVSHRNRYHDNVMGLAPNGSKVPNGVDFWWDEAPAQEDNCWFNNGTVTTDPPDPLMPSNCDNTSAGVTYPAKFERRAGSVRRRRSRAAAATTRPPARGSARRRSPSQDGGGPMGLPVRASGAPKVALLAPDCRLVGSTLSCNGLLDRP